MSNKIIHNPHEVYQHVNSQNLVEACYFPQIPVSEELINELNRTPFTRVMYHNRFGGKNRTPRETWCYGKVNSDVVTYGKSRKFLNFRAEPMPPLFQQLGDYCRQTSLHNWGFDPGYNSCIIGKYSCRDDSIAFHFDTETFLAHHFCANVTIGNPRDFQFRDEYRQAHEIKLQHKSLFFFKALEHALPKRAAVKNGEVRYSISFRNMATDVGISNSYYYCRGLDGAIDDQDKYEYQQALNEL